VLILGLGNILLRDEGVGVRVVQAMELLDLPPEVELFDGATAGLDLLDVLGERRQVIVIDAIEGDIEPGTVLRLAPEDLAPREGRGVSLHELGFMETLTVAKRLGIAPQQVTVFGIKPRDVSWGLELSPEIDRLVPDVVKHVLAELEMECQGPSALGAGQEQEREDRP
jgi:hydrogenase maturation protease